MNKTSTTILNELHSKGEMKLYEISDIVPKKFNDHRDFYPLSSLITQGLIEDSMVAQESFDLNPNYKTYKNQVLAWKLFASANAEKEATYKNHTWSIHGNEERLSDQIFTLTGDGYLYLEKMESEKESKNFTALIATFSAVLAAALTYYMDKI